MMKGFYTAASGLINRSNVVNAIGNNIANSNTAGYKKDEVVLKSFGEQISYRLSNNESTEIGQTNSGVVMDEVYTHFEQGQLQQTQNPFDLALMGDGFFSVQLQNGDKAYTRNGQFKLDQEGYLTDLQGNMVLSKNGPIKVGTSDFTVTASGEIFSGDNSLGTLEISKPTDSDSLEKYSELLYIEKDTGAQMVEAEIIVKQGYTESSNVDMIKEMSDLIENSRAFQSCSQILKIMDRIMEKSVNDIARL